MTTAAKVAVRAAPLPIRCVIFAASSLPISGTIELFSTNCCILRKQPLCHGAPRSYIHWKSITYRFFLEYGAIESWRGWRIVFDATRLFFNTMWAIGFYFREDAGFASGETIKVDRVVDGSGKMCL
jgi:hypothetical protein